MKKGVKRIRRINWKVLIVSILVVYVIAFIGGLFTSTSVNSEWYDSIKPSITPPGWVFPVVWNILYLSIALSFYFAWTSIKTPLKNNNKNIKRNLILLFGINLLFNVSWSYLFFTLQNPLMAFINLLLIWATIILMMLMTRKINKISFYLLIPYFLWVSFAGVLNWVIAF